ncbi:MAG: cytoskeletal protein RodZ [Lentimonas sp.]|jgi:cytoskeleton protein RodZ
MQSIGKRLEEARKNKGISLREASEATKIRSDFLQHIEQDELDFELPEIYKRGFVKNYANYLDLDSKSILTDYSAQLLSTSDGIKKAVGSELFGSMDSQSRSEDTDKPHLGRISANPREDAMNEDTQQDAEIDKTFYVKVGLVVLGVLSFLVVIIGLIAAVLGGGDDPKIEVTSSNTASTLTATTADINAGSPSSSLETVSLIANGNVYVLVKQRNDNKELVRKTLSTGETHEFTKQGPVDILFTAGENLVIVNPAGERLRPKGEGTGKISIP